MTSHSAPLGFLTHGLFHFYDTDMHEKVENQLKKPSVIGLPKFTIVNWLKNTIKMQILL